MTTDGTLDEGKAARRATAESMAAKQRDISVSEFFTKNRHLLGFDNPAKALLTTVKEAVDNALDACEEAGILPSIEVSIEELAEGRYRIRVEDNGPGIVKAQIPKIFAKLLYGSKFHRLRQSRGQQGIGISAAGMYGQLTTGRPIVVMSKTGKGQKTYRLEVRIDARTNNPHVLKDEVVPWEKEHGTAVEIELTGLYRGGRTSVDAYVEQTVVANPHLEMTYRPPRGEPRHFPRVSEALPPEAHEIKPHPHGVELGMLIKFFHEAGDRSVRQTLMEDFSRVTGSVADEICRRAKVEPKSRAARLEGKDIEAIHAVMMGSQAALPTPRRFATFLAKSDGTLREEMVGEGTGFTLGFADVVAKRAGIEPATKSKLVTPAMVDRLYDALSASQVKILPPPATCVVPVGETLILEGLKRRFKADYYVSHTRPPAVYRGNPFVVEAGIAFGGELARDESAELLRFANRVPLLYQPRACGITEAVVKVDWKSYGLQQRRGELPVGPLAIFVHLASVWVPFTSEAKEAVAHYDEIVREIRLALMECGRRLGTWVRAQEAEKWQAERKSLFEKYITEISVSLNAITGISTEKIKDDFHTTLPRHVKIIAPATPADGTDGDGGAAAPAASMTPSEPPPPMEPELPPPASARGKKGKKSDAQEELPLFAEELSDGEPVSRGRARPAPAKPVKAGRAVAAPKVSAARAPAKAPKRKAGRK